MKYRVLGLEILDQIHFPLVSDIITCQHLLIAFSCTKAQIYTGLYVDKEVKQLAWNPCLSRLQGKVVGPSCPGVKRLVS